MYVTQSGNQAQPISRIVVVVRRKASNMICMDLETKRRGCNGGQVRGQKVKAKVKKE